MSDEYSLLIVDDEEWIRRGLVAKVRKSGLPFSDIRAAGGADEAWSLIDAALPDVVICDIRMPGSDGLELCERIARNLPDICLAVVSGFDDFEYARRALTIGVVDYLLKPVEGYELRRALKKAIDRIERRRSLRQSISRANLLTRGAEFRTLIRSGMPLTEQVLGEFFTAFHVGRSVFQAACLLPLPGGAPGQGLEPGIVGSAVETSSDWSGGQNLIWYDGTDRTTTLVFCHGEEEAFDAGVQRLLQSLCTAVERATGSPPSVGLSSPGRSIERSVDEACWLARHGVLRGSAGVIRSEEAGEWSGEYTLSSDRLWILESSMRSGETARIEEVLHDIRREIESVRPSYESVHNVYRHLALVAKEGLQQTKGDWRLDDARPLTHFSTLADAFGYLAELYRSAVDSRAEVPAEAHLHLIYAVKEFIDTHFAEPLSQKEIAARSHMNVSYLSELFHRTVGMTFQDYVTRTRIDEAKLLLSTGSCRMSEVAERSGFSDYTYFSKVFRRLEGMSPREFSDLHRREIILPG